MRRFDPLALIPRIPLRALARCRVPEDLDAITSLAPETPAEAVGLEPAAIERVWEAALALYRTGFMSPNNVIEELSLLLVGKQRDLPATIKNPTCG